MIVGNNPIFEALKSERTVSKVIISNQISTQVEREVPRLAKRSNTPVQKLPRQKMDKISSAKHQGIIAYVSAYDYVSIEEILQIAKKRDELPFIMILDELEDPYNLGAILRSEERRVGKAGIYR